MNRSDMCLPHEYGKAAKKKTIESDVFFRYFSIFALLEFFTDAIVKHYLTMIRDIFFSFFLIFFIIKVCNI